MDKLKEIMAQKKQQQAGQKWVKVGDVEKQKAEKYYQEQQELERQKQEKAQKKLEETLEYYKPQKKHQKDPITGTEVNMLENPGETPAVENNSEQNPEKEPPIPKKEVVKKLRARKEPVTLFGETDWMRYERLCKFEKESVDHVKHEGQANIFQKDLTLNEDEFKKMIDIIDEDIPYEKLIERLEKNKKPRDYNQQEYKGRKKVSLSEGISKEDKCDDILYWCKKILKDWERELQNQGEFDNPSSESKNIIGQYRQCRRHIQPLLLLFRNRDVNEEILDALYHIVHFCILKEYVKAHDKYLEIAIGNAPWPMGVTMVGIHERSGRSKIFSSQIAHVLNDETQRKYLQAIKRLMTIAQKHEPADYSRNVNM